MMKAYLRARCGPSCCYRNCSEYDWWNNAPMGALVRLEAWGVPSCVGRGWSGFGFLFIKEYRAPLRLISQLARFAGIIGLLHIQQVFCLA